MAYRQEDAGSRRLYQRALAVMPAGNTRHSIALGPYPVYLRSGHGCRVVDVEGQERIDFLNNFTSLILGHADPDVTAAVQARVALGTAFAGPTEADVQLAEALVGRIPSLELVRFCNSGSEAVLLGLKAARAFTGRPRIAKIEGAYHGLYDYAQASEAPAPDDWGPADQPASVVEKGCAPGMAADVVVLPWNDADACERLIEANRESLAAVLVDALPMGLSLIPPRPGFLERLREVTREHGILLVADEVLTFRLGYHGAFHEHGIRPDLVCLGKIIGGGFPAGAVGGREEVMTVFDHTRGALVHHGGTYNGNPVTATAGLITLEKMTPAAYARLNGLGDLLREKLRALLVRRGRRGQVLGRGSLFSVRLTDEPLHDWRSLSRHTRASPIYGLMCHEMLARGVVISPRGIVGCLSTPMGEAELVALVDAFDETLTVLDRPA
ncbi:MAG TPA: aspartate aminotransferase family protein [Vicinamibacteria bacterium]|nr:aspartate aminotransferase family protein [Vicinamibacteria bacterium]